MGRWPCARDALFQVKAPATTLLLRSRQCRSRERAAVSSVSESVIRSQEAGLSELAMDAVSGLVDAYTVEGPGLLSDWRNDPVRVRAQRAIVDAALAPAGTTPAGPRPLDALPGDVLSSAQHAAVAAAIAAVLADESLAAIAEHASAEKSGKRRSSGDAEAADEAGARGEGSQGSDFEPGAESEKPKLGSENVGVATLQHSALNMKDDAVHID